MAKRFSARVRTIASAVIAGAFLFPASPAIAAETDQITTDDVVSEESTTPVPVEDGAFGESDIISGGDASNSIVPMASGKIKPYECIGKVDRPHQSHTTKNTINVHFDTKCRRTATNLSTEGSLYRSRWYGWEHLTSRKGSKKVSYKLRVVAPKGCKKGTLYRYRGQARFYVSGAEGRGSSHIYNQNDKEIRCGK